MQPWGLVWVKGYNDSLRTLWAGDKPRHYKVNANLPALSNQWFKIVLQFNSLNPSKMAKPLNPAT
jgi:hypothetical protein